MKYLVRAIKYFFWFSILFALIMVALVLLGIADSSPELMFRDGWKSVAYIAVLFGAVAAFYPIFGFITKDVVIPGGYSDIRDGVVEVMESRGYRLESEEGEDMTFRLRSKVSAIFKMLEDRITLTRTEGGFAAEGLTKEVVRIAGALEYRFRDRSLDGE